MDAPSAAAALQALKDSLVGQLAAVQTAIDALDANIALTFPNLDTVIAESAAKDVQIADLLAKVQSP